MRLAAAILATVVIGGSAAAQEAPIARGQPDAPPPVATSIAPAPSPRTSALSQSAGDPTADQIADWLKQDAAPIQPLDPHAPGALDITGAPRQIHGEVGAIVSNRGYAGYARTSIPLGEASELELGVGAGQFHTRYGGRIEPRSLSVGLFLDGRDVQRWISRDKCNVPRWGVRLKDDPELLPDGSCVRSDAKLSGPTPAR